MSRFLSLLLITLPTVALAGGLYGPAVQSGVVAARSTASWTVQLQANRLARLVVRGDGDTDLDCFLIDAYGRVLASDEDGSDLCLLPSVPRYSGAYTLRVVNHGRVWNAVTIALD